MPSKKNSSEEPKSIKERLKYICKLQGDEKKELRKLTKNKKLNNKDNEDKIEKLRVSTKNRRIEITELQDLCDKEYEKEKNVKLKSSIALDCEMVGVGKNGEESVLARCSLVDYDGNVLYNKFVQPKGVVTDYRTEITGIRKEDLNNKNAIPFEQCKKEVADLLKGKILVGHDIEKDLKALELRHPETQIKDTSRYQPYMTRIPNSYNYKPRSLKDLTKTYLNLDIQTDKHNPVEDARCTMKLYRLLEEWEKKKRLEAKVGRLKKDEEGSLLKAELERLENSENERFKMISEELMNSLKDPSRKGRNDIMEEQKSDKKKLRKMNNQFNKLTKEEKLNNIDKKEEIEKKKKIIEERKIQLQIIEKLNKMEKK